MIVRHVKGAAMLTENNKNASRTTPVGAWFIINYCQVCCATQRVLSQRSLASRPHNAQHVKAQGKEFTIQLIFLRQFLIDISHGGR